jgi:hypothetical protein
MDCCEYYQNVWVDCCEYYQNVIYQNIIIMYECIIKKLSKCINVLSEHGFCQYYQKIKNMDVSVCEWCIQWLSQNEVTFLCQPCGTIGWVHAKFQDCFITFAIYFILSQLCNN